jgi:hypothetical protein
MVGVVSASVLSAMILSAAGSVASGPEKRSIDRAIAAVTTDRTLQLISAVTADSDHA